MTFDELELAEKEFRDRMSKKYQCDYIDSLSRLNDCENLEFKILMLRGMIKSVLAYSGKSGRYNSFDDIVNYVINSKWMLQYLNGYLSYETVLSTVQDMVKDFYNGKCDRLVDQDKENKKKAVKKSIEKFIENALRSDSMVKRNLADAWLSGSSTLVRPITASIENDFTGATIELQWNSNREPKVWLGKIKDKYKNVIKNAWFWKSDGSCPNTVSFEIDLREEFLL